MADTVAYISSGAAGLAHVTGPGHPERPERLDAVDAGVTAAEVPIHRFEGRHATVDEMALVHDRDYLETIRDFAGSGGGWIDPDTRICAASWDAAALAAGCGLSAVEILRRGDATTAFVAVRPPGHHATARAAMGFCLVNNVAVTAAHLARRGERVLIVDWDVHHGNGTQEMFWDDPAVMYASTHQWPAYPGTGRPQEMGGPAAAGLNINFPLPPGATGDVALAALREVVEPAVQRFRPTWVLISAGFDAHRDDPLADLQWSAGDYSLLTDLVRSWAPGPGRTVAFLEGGYDLAALSLSAQAMVGALAGAPAATEEPSRGGPGISVVEAVGDLRRRAGL